METGAKYLNPDLPIEERVQDLLSRMTIEEKISQTRNACSAIPRLGIPEYDYWSEALHGVARNGRATVFPQAIGMAATWDRVLIHDVASAIGDEGRAKFHYTLKKNGRNLIFQGLTFWSPNVNIFRDPRWGRGQETWGEDPYLTGELGSEFVKGLQGDDPKYMKAAACAKHYAVHSGPEKLRHVFDAVVSRQDLYATYLPAFKRLVQEGKVEAVMGAYNRVYGDAANASHLLLEDILRDEWGFNGHVVSDCGALTDIHQNHKITKNGAESAALALKNGCDIGCDCVFYDFLPEALAQSLVTEADIDKALARTLATRFKLGLFDPDERVPYAQIPLSVVGSEKHTELAYKAAVESVVLLKNKNSILPIDPNSREVYVVGPNAGATNVLLGNYYGLNNRLVTLLEGFVGRLPEGILMGYMPGTQVMQDNVLENDWSSYQAAQADVTIAFMGTAPIMEGEEGEAIMSDNGDRTSISLPPNQVKYIKKLAAGGGKVVLVLTGGSPIALEGIEDMVDAIVFVWYPGQEGGRAVADVLFGDHSPSGKLPLTFPQSLDDLPPFEDYSMAGRTYRYATKEPLFPFGFGLSYTTFAYNNLIAAHRSVKKGEALTVKVDVTNTGSRDGAEVVQFYLSDLEASTTVPLTSLIGFERVALAAGETKTVEFTVTPEAMSLVDEDGKLVLEPGKFRLTVGGSSPSERALALGAPEPQYVEFHVVE